MKLIYSLSLVLFWTTVIQAQDYQDLFQKVYNTYTNTPHYGMEVTTHQFGSKQDTKGIKASGKIRKSGQQYYSKYGADEFIMNESYALIVDHRTKMITHYKLTEEERKQLFNNSTDYLKQLENWKKGGNTIKQQEKTNDKVTFRTTMSRDSPIKTAEIVINTTNYTMDFK